MAKICEKGQSDRKSGRGERHTLPWTQRQMFNALPPKAVVTGHSKTRRVSREAKNGTAERQGVAKACDSLFGGGKLRSMVTAAILGDC